MTESVLYVQVKVLSIIFDATKTFKKYI